MTNKELAALVAELRGEIEELKFALNIKQEVDPIPEPAGPSAEERYYETIADEVEAWEAKVDAITAKRAEELTKQRGAGLSKLKIEAIRQKVEADFPYEGPPRSYSKYLAVKRMEATAEAEKQEQERASEGVADHQFKDIFGITRDRIDGRISK